MTEQRQVKPDESADPRVSAIKKQLDRLPPEERQAVLARIERDQNVLDLLGPKDFAKFILQNQMPGEVAMGRIYAEPHVPGRLPDLLAWQSIWSLIRPQFRKGHSYTRMANWLQRMHPELHKSELTIADICKAGEAGLLSD